MCAKCGKPTVATVCDKCRRSDTEARIDARMGRGLCPLCNKSPKKKGSRFCHTCGENVAKAKNGNGPAWKNAFRFMVWRGYGVYTVQSGVAVGDDGCEHDMYRIEPLPASAIAKLPKSGDRVINLDAYCKGFSPASVRQFKKAIMRAHGLKCEPSRN